MEEAFLSLGRSGERTAQRKDYTFTKKKLFQIGQSYNTGECLRSKKKTLQMD
jgi:hypothetical protein